MLKMHLAAGLAAAALMTTAAVAQTSAPTAPAGQGQIMTQMPQDLMRGSKLMGIDVYGADNQKIGDVDEVLVDRQGKIQGIVVGIGGFLGIGQKDIAIPYDQVQWMTSQEVQAQSNQGGGQGGSGNAAGGSGGGAGGMATTTGNTAGGAGGGAGGTTGSTSSTLGGAGGAGGTATSGAGGSTGAPAGAGGAAGTSTAGGTGGDANMPARAMVRMTKADLQNAPEFQYSPNQGNQSGGGGAGSAGGAGGGAGAGATGGAGGGAGGAGGSTNRP